MKEEYRPEEGLGQRSQFPPQAAFMAQQQSVLVVRARRLPREIHCPLTKVMKQ